MKNTGLLKTILTLIFMVGALNSWSHIPGSKTHKMAQKRIHAFFSGKVQGVGFRYTTKQYATKLGLIGWVKNLPDSRVEMVAEGEEKQLTTLLTQLELKFTIVKSEIKAEPNNDKLIGFQIIR